MLPRSQHGKEDFWVMLLSGKCLVPVGGDLNGHVGGAVVMGYRYESVHGG